MSEPSSPNILTITNSRFQVLDRPVAAPGKCVVCGAVDRPVVDTRWDMDYYGVVYFCIDCLSEVARIIGMVDGNVLHAAEVNSVRSFNDYLNKNDLVVISRVQYVSWVNSINSLHYDTSCHILSHVVPSDPETAPTESATDENSSRTSKQEFKFAGDERPISVPASSDNGESLFNL